MGHAFLAEQRCLMKTVRLSWVDLNSGASQEDEFRIYRSTAPIDPDNLPAPLATLPPDTEVYDDGDAADGTNYYYAVGALKDGGEALSFIEITVGEVAPFEIVYFEMFDSHEFEVPEIAQSGDIAFVFVGAGAGVTDPSPAGWNILSWHTNGRTEGGVIWKVLNGTEGTEIIGDAGEFDHFVLGVVIVSGANTTTPIVDWSSDNHGGNSKAHFMNEVSVTSPNQMILAHACGGWGGAFTYTSIPAGLTELGQKRTIDGGLGGCVNCFAKYEGPTIGDYDGDFVNDTSLFYITHAIVIQSK